MLPSRRVVIAAAAITLLAAGAAMAQSSLGIGAAEPAITPTGPFAGTLQWINTQQQAFYRTLTGALKAMREDGSRLWVLIGLSFAYGVFHAAGPGHGKAVISSYMLANEVALRRGVILS
ncbi:MAG: delayed-early response protein/equilibrative nucleoside transporter, partial [Nitratireductor sp.]